MRIWQYTSTVGGLEKNLKINPSAPLPKPKANQHLVQIIATALNPVDYKPAEIPYVGALIRPKAATPGIDFAGRIVKPAQGSPLKPGQLIFGASGSGSPIAGGGLAEFGVTGVENSAAIPDGVDPIHAATVAVAGLTAYQSIVPKVKKGDRIFINGGSGGCGVFGIQFAKAAGCHVTTSCSTKNVELCKSLGADEVFDYKKGSVSEALKSSSHKFDHAVDNVGHDKELYWQCHEFMKPGAAYVLIAGELSFASLADIIKRKTLPGFLGGIKGNVTGFFPKPNPMDIGQIGEWIRDGRIKAVIDERFPFEQAPKAFEKLKTGRARGKIVVEIAPNLI